MTLGDLFGDWSFLDGVPAGGTILITVLLTNQEALSPGGPAPYETPILNTLHQHGLELVEFNRLERLRLSQDPLDKVWKVTLEGERR